MQQRRSTLPPGSENKIKEETKQTGFYASGKAHQDLMQ